MSELTVEQHQLLFEYDQLLNTISDALEYLEKNIKKEALPEVQQVFQDVLLALDKASTSHEQMVALFNEDINLITLIGDFHDVVKLLQQWFELETNEEKRQLLVEKVVPAFESWRSQMQSYVKPYIVH
ncbi:hypothetical protein SAMN05216353_10588 [Halobacillus alkaliphilus]|uniref:DUF8042 domain-containing protein n=1 Tax=Halobacillus alkaliphilus TaxID=396056 RepID=A0A1I2KNM3_9BACI|nr:hypothetical protein [Halobacillus alkaliphilus]SFF68103.1 hypothetical protein SAMN05216353_10588 [Halobacillus alkaliphilus]